MKRRIIKVILLLLSMPVVLVCAFSIVVTGIIAMFMYIARGDEKDELMDFVLHPMMWAINLPYKLMGEE